MYINLKIRNDVPLQVPADSCCNCGATEGVKPEATSLKHMPFMGIAGAEVTMPFTFPYCAQCRATATRRRPTLIGKVVLSAAIALGLITAWFFLAGRFVDMIPIEYAATGLSLLAIAVVFGAYAFADPVAIRLLRTSLFASLKSARNGQQT